MKYRKKPVVVDAIPTATTNVQEILNFCDGHAYVNKYDQEMYIETLEGTMRVGRNDWIIKGVRGEYYSVKPDVFEETYSKVIE